MIISWSKNRIVIMDRGEMKKCQPQESLLAQGLASGYSIKPTAYVALLKWVECSAPFVVLLVFGVLIVLSHGSFADW